MVNKVASLGALVCIVAAALSTGLLLTDEFVEVFVALGNGETSCAIGFLGVNEAGFDASCLSVAELQLSSLGGADPDGNKVFSIEAFTAPTEEFKLLFPTQQEFYYEINPFYTRYVDCLAAPLAERTFACSEAEFAAVFPTFDGENCDTFYSQLYVTQSIVFGLGQNTINVILGALFTEGPIETLLTPFYDQSAFLGLISILAGGANATLEGLIDGAFITDNGPFVTADAAESATYMGAIAASPSPPAPAGSVFLAGLAVSSTCGVGFDIVDCFGLTLGGAIPDVTGTNYWTETYNNTFCEAIIGADIGCTFEQMSQGAIPLIEAAIDSDPTNALLPELLAVWNGAVQIGQLLETGLMDVRGDDGVFISKTVLPGPFINNPLFTNANSVETIGVAARNLLLASTNNFTYPSTILGETPYCTFLQAVGAFGNLSKTTCDFQFFVLNSASAAAAGGLDDSVVSLALSLTTLFGACFQAIAGGAFTDPNSCWDFFPAALLNLAFSGGLDTALAQVNVTDASPGLPVFNAAAAACEDDIADLEAIESAQAISPVGIVFLGAAAVFAVVSVAVNNKVIAGVAGGVSLLGTLLILIALITVYNAPIYSSVGGSDDAEAGEIVYLSGQTVSLGLGAIAMGAIGGIIMIVSVFTFSKSDSAEAKALGAATEKPVSI